MTLAQSLENSSAPPEILRNQMLLAIPFVDFEGEVQIGQLVVARELADEVTEVFRLILIARFPLFCMTPVVTFNWSDDESMEANNCSAFNYRLRVGKTSLSAHALGRAIDINPRQNPYMKGDLVLPQGAVYDVSAPGTLVPEGEVVRIFEDFGWEWGGRWKSLQDYHHFEKAV